MFVIEVPCFNLDQIYNSMQCPRWIKFKEMKYAIPFRDKVLKIEQAKERLIMSCSEEDFYNIWFKYFDLQTDYMGENNNVKKAHKKFKIPANRGSGVHILNQDVFEMYIFAKLIHKLGWENARSTINEIAASYGVEHRQSMREVGRVVWYEFPTPKSLLEKLDSEKRRTSVNKFLYKLSDAIVNRGFNIIENDDKLFRLLGLHDTNQFPVVGLENTIEKNFKCDAYDFEDEFLSNTKLKNYGLLYMCILHHVKNPPAEVS